MSIAFLICHELCRDTAPIFIALFEVKVKVRFQIMNAKHLLMFKIPPQSHGKAVLRRRSQRLWKSTGEKLTQRKIREKILWKEPEVSWMEGICKAKNYHRHFKPSRLARSQHPKIT